MLNKIACYVTAAALSVGLLSPQAVAQETSAVLVDGEVVENVSPIVYEQTAYVSLRNLTMALRPDATVSWENGQASVQAEGLSITARPGLSYFQANGRYLYLPQGVCVENDEILLPVRELAKAMDAQVWWEESDGNIYVTSGSGAITSGEEYYDSDALYWLSHIIYAESGNQPLLGKIAVGNVILNRVNSPLFPNSIYGVVTQANQFTTIYSSTFQQEPNAESLIAAKLCLDGAVALPTALWFNRAGVDCWASRNKTCVATIGAHSFYA